MDPLSALQTPHTADTIHQIVPLFSERIHANIVSLLAGNGRFEGVVDPQAGY
jgi:hypothetical protein